MRNKRKQPEQEAADQPGELPVDEEGASDIPSDSGSDEEPSSGSSGSSGDEDGSSSGPEVSDEPEAGDSDDPDAFDKIDVNFEFFDPKESDFHGLKALLHSYLDGQQYDSSPLVDAIIQQSQVGTVVRTGADEDPIAVMTVLNTQQHKGSGFMSHIKDRMLSKCRDTAVKQQLSKAWEQPGTGLLINERLINSPPQLAPPLVQALFSEISWATEDEPTQERRDAFKFKRYLLMTRVFCDPLPPEQAAAAAGGAGPSNSSGKNGGKPPAGPGRPPKAPRQQQHPAKKQKQQQQQGQQSPGPVVVYVRPEDEFFHQHASASFTFPVEGRAVGKDELQPLRLVMLLPASKVEAARAALDKVVGNMAAQQ